MAQIKQPPLGPRWPWGGPRSVRERLVDPAQLERRKTKKGDPKNPPLASAALMDFIGPAHSSEELRLPLPPQPPGMEAELQGFSDRPHLQTALHRAGEEQTRALERRLSRLSVPADRLGRLQALMRGEEQMLELLRDLNQDVEEIQRRIREELREEGY
jgi:hypothetical protein